MYTEIRKCRVCGSPSLVEVLSLGEQALTGVFPKPGEQVSSGPLDLVWCQDCSLLQMKQSYNLGEMYGDNYGYRSGLNQSMVSHLKWKILNFDQSCRPEDLVVDIGSNDGTALKYYTNPKTKVGIDPTGKKFKKFYPADVDLIPDFFSADLFNQHYPNRKAKVVTSIAMFYDLESPETFVKDVRDILAPDGIWHFEQSYMPSMLRSNAYDAVCHEHLEFYSFKVINHLLNKCGMRATFVEMNSVNGGSIAVTACRKESKLLSNTALVDWTLRQEAVFDTPRPYRDFEQRVYQHRRDLVDLIKSLVKDGKTIFGYGASTKGNVLLQFCGITPDLIPYIAEVNPDKFGCVTPGTGIPIISEADARAMNPDYFLVFPWHFKQNILAKEKDFKGKFIFPLPEIEII